MTELEEAELTEGQSRALSAYARRIAEQPFSGGLIVPKASKLETPIPAFRAS
jgi:hypothetical protein